MIDHTIGMMDKPDCNLCRKVYGDDPPPCADCVPPLKKESELLMKIFYLTRSQIGVNNASVFQIIERYVSGFERQEYCFEVLQAVSAEVNAFVAERNSKQQQHTIQ